MKKNRHYELAPTHVPKRGLRVESVSSSWTKFDPEGLDASNTNPPPPPPPQNSKQQTSPGTKQATSPAPSAKGTSDDNKQKTGDSDPKVTKATGRLAVDTDGTTNNYGDSPVNHKPVASGVMDKNGNIVPKYLPDGKVNPAGLPKNGGRDLDAEKDAYGVAPKNLAKVNGGPYQVGDKKTTETPNGVTTTVPIGDFGPEGKNGELSVKGVQNQGYKVIPPPKGDDSPEPSVNGKTTPNIPVNVEYSPK